MAGHTYPAFVCACPRIYFTKFALPNFPCSFRVTTPSGAFLSTLVPFALLKTAPIPTHSTMAKVLIPSLNPHSITNSPWSVPVNLTFSRAEQFLLKLFAIVRYHLHTAILFTWTDYKTIFLPIVSSPIRHLFLSSRDTLPRRRPLHVLRRL
jgi:hypothetical protein